MNYEILAECKSGLEFNVGDSVIDFSNNGAMEELKIKEISGDDLTLVHEGTNRGWQSDFRCVRKIKRVIPLTYWGVFIDGGFRFYDDEKIALNYQDSVDPTRKNSQVKKFQEVKG